MEKYKSLIKKASQFVEKQKGVWDHSKWQAFLSDTEKMGGTMNEEMRRYLGAVTESMKRFYEHSAGTGKKMTGTVSDQAAKFVDKSRGKWEHLEWEKFVKDLQRKGADVTEHNRAHLGGILEAAKKFYHSWPKVAEVEEEELLEERPKPKIKATSVRKPAAKKVTRAKSPKSEGEAPTKKTAKKTQPKKSKSTTTTRGVKSASPKKKAAAKPAPKKPATKGKAKSTTAKGTSPKKQAATKSTTKKAVKSKATSATKKK
ncbi:MAG: hypothetical protein GQ522_02005 [Deltaproteobacteria bacterium]|nr:hypothetical protein [Deltaproteobacteria bacterium]